MAMVSRLAWTPTPNAMGHKVRTYKRTTTDSGWIAVGSALPLGGSSTGTDISIEPTTDYRHEITSVSMTGVESVKAIKEFTSPAASGALNPPTNITQEVVQS